MIFPTVSPRIYLQNEYPEALNGFFFTQFFNNIVTTAAKNSFNAFPSAHCGMSLLVPIYSYRMGMYKYTMVSGIVAVIICISTQVLRYHYFSDLLGSVLLVIFGVWIGGFYSETVFNKSLELNLYNIQKFNFETVNNLLTGSEIIITKIDSKQNDVYNV
jgi:membrane-associated phospholipid phosphatase